MEHQNYFKLKITPVDAAVEWFVKGMNIGLIYGYCFRCEVPQHANPFQHKVQVMKYIARNSVVTGCVLSTWWLFNKSLERAFQNDFWGNYSVSGVLVLLIWHRQLDIAPQNIKKYIVPAALFCGILGKIISG